MALTTASQEQSNFWDGPGGDHWVEHEQVYNGSVANYMTDFMETAAIQSTDIVLDIGCGNGETSRLAAQVAAAGRVVGVDISAAMVKTARRRAQQEGLANLEFVQADAQIFDLGEDAFDVAISRTGAMFFADPIVAFSNIGKSLKSSGRLTLLAWQPYERNEWQYALTNALAMGRKFPKPEVSKPGPMGLADPKFTQRVLAASGFEDVTIRPLERPFTFGADAQRAFEFITTLGFAKGALEPLDPQQREIALTQLRAVIDEHAQPDGVWFGSAAWLISAVSS